MHDHVEHVRDPEPRSPRSVGEAILKEWDTPPPIHGSRADSLAYGEPAELRPYEPSNPLADLLRGLPPGTVVTVTLETRMGDKP